VEAYSIQAAIQQRGCAGKSTLRALSAAWPLVISLLLPGPTRGETAVQTWVQRYSGTGYGSDQASAIATDSSNNVIVTGYSIASASDYDYATIKYSSAGTPLWTNRYNGPGNGSDQAKAVAVDGSNNVIVTGYSTGNTSSKDYATIKYSSAGVPLWTNRYNGPGNGDDEAQALTLDSGNNVIVTGWATSSTSGYDYTTIKYSSEGVPLWTNTYDGPGHNTDCAMAVRVDGGDDVIVTGYSYSSSASFSADYATVKYTSSGQPLWTNRYNGPGKSADQALAVAVDGNNNVIVTGGSYGSGSSSDYATIQYSSTGVPLWTNRYDGPYDSADQAAAVAVDGSNNVIVTGYALVASNSTDYTTFKYSSTGIPLWTNVYNGPGHRDDQATALAVDQSNNVIVTGWSTDSGGSRGYATLKYSSAGEPLWTNRYHGRMGGDDQAAVVAVDGSGNVIVTGYSMGSGGDYDYATVKYTFPLLMSAPKVTNGTYQAWVDNLKAGTLVIEASTNLAGWAPVFTNTTPTNVFFYTDSDAGNRPMRFYRAFQFP
jgi:uncharacterized delta-60 repeat protein